MSAKARSCFSIVFILIFMTGCVFFSTGRFSVAAETEPQYLYSYRLSEKIRKDKSGNIINQAEITGQENTTYPFTFKAYDTAGSDWGMPGTQRYPKTLMTENDREGSIGYLYAQGTWTGITPAGGIAGISAGTKDASGLIYSFSMPHSGQVRITDMYVEYNWWSYVNGIVVEEGNPVHNERPYHSVYGTFYNEAFEGYKFRIEVNGRRVYPAATDWNDTSFTKKYEEATLLGDPDLPEAMFEAGDLQYGKQYAEPIEGIYALKGDEVEIILTSIQTPEESMNLESAFDAVFSIAPTDEMKDYKYTTSVLDSFSIEKKPTAFDTLSYWYYDVSQGLYAKAVRKQMAEIDYANSVYCSSIFGKSATIGFNSMNAVEGVDAAICYRAPVTGNLSITSNNLYRGKDIALYRYFDDFYTAADSTLQNCDGVRIRIELNNERVWPTDAMWKEFTPTRDNRGVFDWEDVNIGVQQGDTVTVRVNANANETYDELNFTPMFELSPTDSPMSNPPLSVQDGAGKDSSAALVIGLTVGGAVVVAGAVTAIVLVKKKNKRRVA